MKQWRNNQGSFCLYSIMILMLLGFLFSVSFFGVATVRSFIDFEHAKGLGVALHNEKVEEIENLLDDVLSANG